jgi:hypothetical protein
MFVRGVNPVLHADQIPAGRYLEQNGPWLEEANTVIVAPDGTVIAGPPAAAPQNRKEEPSEHHPSDQRIRG